MCSGDRKLNLVTFGNEIIGYVTKSTYHTSNPKSCVMYHFAVCNAEIWGVIDLTLPPLPEEEYPLPVRSICLNLFRKTL